MDADAVAGDLRGPRIAAVPRVAEQLLPRDDRIPGGSLVSDRIEDYYVDPIEVGYGGLVDWDRDFVGRDALRQRADNQRRTKVTLEWNDDDVADVIKDSLAAGASSAVHCAAHADVCDVRIGRGASRRRPCRCLAVVVVHRERGHLISTALVNLDMPPRHRTDAALG